MTKEKESHRRWRHILIWFLVIVDLLCLVCLGLFLGFNLADIEGKKGIVALTITDLISSSLTFILSIIVPVLNNRFASDYYLDAHGMHNSKEIVQAVYLNLLFASLILLICGSIFYLLELNFALIGVLIDNIFLLILFIIVPGIMMILSKNDYIFFMAKHCYEKHYYFIDKQKFDDYKAKDESKRHYFFNEIETKNVINQKLIREGFESTYKRFNKKKNLCEDMVFSYLARCQLSYANSQFEQDIYSIDKPKVDVERTSIALVKNLFYICDNDKYFHDTYYDKKHTYFDSIYEAICHVFTFAKMNNCSDEVNYVASKEIGNLLIKCDKPEYTNKEVVLSLLDGLAVESMSRNNTWFIEALNENFVGTGSGDFSGSYCAFITFYFMTFLITEYTTVSNENRNQIEYIMSRFSWSQIFRAQFINATEEDLAKLYEFLIGAFKAKRGENSWTPLMANRTSQAFVSNDFNEILLLETWLYFVFYNMASKKFSIKIVHDGIKKLNDATYLANIKDLLEHIKNHLNFYDYLVDLLDKLNFVYKSESKTIKDNLSTYVNDYLNIL